MPQEPIRHGAVYGGTYTFPHENAAVGGMGEGAEKQLLPAGEANLPQTSKVRLGLAQPWLKIRLGQRSGQVSPAKMREVDIKLLRLFGFSAKHP